MLDIQERTQIVELIKKEVVPAIGCTEPIAVALCVAKATEILGKTPEKITVYLSPNILKNAMGVGIPGTDMIGLPIAIALGAIVGKSEYQLEVLKNTDSEAVNAGKQMIGEKRIGISLKENNTETLYIEAICESGNDRATAIISESHTNFIYISLNNNILLHRKEKSLSNINTEKGSDLNLRKIYEFATETPLSEIDFIRESGIVNKEAANQSLKGDYGHSLGKTLQGDLERQTMGDSVFSNILSYTSAACDARMAGAKIPVMSNSGSGNQGIAATLPVVIYGERYNESEEKITRALALSNLTVIYIKQYMGRLSALCGCVVAATGSSCGITYLMGGEYEQISYAVKNMIANLTGMICDGAKPSCSLKLTSGVSTSIFSAMMAMEGKCVSSVEGIIDDDVDQTVKNLALIGKYGMRETDKLVLDIMVNK